MIKLTTFPTEVLGQTDQLFVTIAQELTIDTIGSDRDNIQLGNLLDKARKEVEALSDKDASKLLLEQIERARQHARELINAKGGLALYITSDDVYYYHLGIPTLDYVSVGVSPNVIPLIENFQYTNNYHVLILNREDIRLFKGNALSVEEITLDDEEAPITLNDALGDELSADEQSHGSYGGQGGEGGNSIHGHHETSKEKDIDRDNYFRIVDKYIMDHYSSPTDLPLILYALPENQAVFRQLSKNACLLDQGIEESGANVKIQTVKEKATAKNLEIVKQDQESMFNRFRETSPKFRIDNQLNDLAMNSLQGRIEELLVNKGYQQNGSIGDEGDFQEGDGDFVKQLIGHVLNAKGKVYVVPADEMPVGINLSARLRY